jgi:hypothetical protein
MRTFAMLFVAGLVALCVGAAHAETKEPIFGVLRTPKGYMVVWNESKAHFKVELPGKELRRSEIAGLAIFIDEHLFQILVADLADFATGEISPKAILDRYMQYELKHWQDTVGMPMPSTVHARDQAQDKTYMLWEIRWPEQAIQKDEAKGKAAIKQLFLSAMAGDKVMIVSRTVLEGEDEGAALQYLSEVARSLVISSAKIDIWEIQHQIQRDH